MRRCVFILRFPPMVPDKFISTNPDETLPEGISPCPDVLSYSQTPDLESSLQERVYACQRIRCTEIPTTSRILTNSFPKGGSRNRNSRSTTPLHLLHSHWGPQIVWARSSLNARYSWCSAFFSSLLICGSRKGSTATRGLRICKTSSS
jgi:hypothetical protein